MKSTRRRYAVGLQRHPERVTDEIDQPERTFTSFVGATAALTPAR